MASFFTDLNNYIKHNPIEYMRDFGIDIEPEKQSPCPVCGGNNRFTWYSKGKHSNSGFCRHDENHGGYNILQPLTIISAVTKLEYREIGAHIGFNKSAMRNNPNHFVMRNAPKKAIQQTIPEPLDVNQLQEFKKVASNYYKNATYRISPYLYSKGILKLMWVTGHDKTLLPYHKDNQCSALQAISKDGSDKNLIKFSQGSGAYYAEWHKNTEIKTIFVGEGFATVCAIQEALAEYYYGSLFATARSANNLCYVAKELRSIYPNAQICILTDNDNGLAGLKFTKKVLGQVDNCWWAMPLATGEDWCDVFQRGKSYLRDEFQRVLTNLQPSI